MNPCEPKCSNKVAEVGKEMAHDHHIFPFSLHTLMCAPINTDPVPTRTQATSLLACNFATGLKALTQASVSWGNKICLEDDFYNLYENKNDDDNISIASDIFEDRSMAEEVLFDRKRDSESANKSSEDSSKKMFSMETAQREADLAQSQLRLMMMKSIQSQDAIQAWDRLNGLPASHSKTMVNTNRSRKQLLEGVILRKWNGSPLIS
jgi:hypothetical protein